MRYYDVIVVGAGPAGAATAKVLADNQAKTLVFERGAFPGAKNMFGGAIYSEPLVQLLPAFWNDAPLERIVTKEELWLLDQDSAVNFGFTGLRYGKEPYNKITVLRPKFDAWYAKQATDAGAVLQTNALVTEVLAKKKLGGKKEFYGVRLEDGSEAYADIIVVCEGAINLLAQKTGLGNPLKAEETFLYIKEVLSMSPERIESRFNLEKGEGAIYLILGYPGLGRVNKFGLFTNKDSISIILGGYISHMMSSRVNPTDLMEKIKQHPLVKRLISGGERVEFMSHLIPKGGAKAVPKLHTNGLLLAGDTATMVSERRGIDLAALSGIYAAETAQLALAKGDTSEKVLNNYQYKIKNAFFNKNMKRSPNVASYFEKHKDADFIMSRTLNRMGYEFFHVGLDTDTEKISKLIRIAKDIQHPLKSLQDIYAGIKDWSI